MSYPQLHEYNEAVQNPLTAFNDAELQRGSIERDGLGIPRPRTGGFASVYRVQCGSRTWAVRCFRRDVLDQRFRYQAISKYLQKVNLPYTVAFVYLYMHPVVLSDSSRCKRLWDKQIEGSQIGQLQRVHVLEQGIRIRGNWFPILKMDWIEGEPLNIYIERNLSNTKKLLTLAAQWLKMMNDLQQFSIAHGDLQHGNVLIAADNIRLVDYDAMYVPELEGRASNEVGLPHYQHPSRNASHFGPMLDNFSAWVIYMSIRALGTNPELWYELEGGDECLLFRKTDFLKPDSSIVFNMLAHSNDPGLNHLTSKFRSFVSLPLSEVPSLYKQASDSEWRGDHPRKSGSNRRKAPEMPSSIVHDGASQEKAWRVARKANTVEAYEEYLSKWKNGPYTYEALQRIALQLRKNLLKDLGNIPLRRIYLTYRTVAQEEQDVDEANYETSEEETLIRCAVIGVLSLIIAGICMLYTVFSSVQNVENWGTIIALWLGFSAFLGFCLYLAWLKLHENVPAVRQEMLEQLQREIGPIRQADCPKCKDDIATLRKKYLGE